MLFISNEIFCFCFDDFIIYVKNCFYQYVNNFIFCFLIQLVVDIYCRFDCFIDVFVWYDFLEDVCNIISFFFSVVVVFIVLFQFFSFDVVVSILFVFIVEIFSVFFGVVFVFGNVVVFGFVVIGVFVVIGGVFLF